MLSTTVDFQLNILVNREIFVWKGLLYKQYFSKKIVLKQLPILYGSKYAKTGPMFCSCCMKPNTWGNMARGMKFFISFRYLSSMALSTLIRHPWRSNMRAIHDQNMPTHKHSLAVKKFFKFLIFHGNKWKRINIFREYFSKISGYNWLIKTQARLFKLNKWTVFKVNNQRILFLKTCFFRNLKSWKELTFCHS